MINDREIALTLAQEAEIKFGSAPANQVVERAEAYFRFLNPLTPNAQDQAEREIG